MLLCVALLVACAIAAYAGWRLRGRHAQREIHALHQRTLHAEHALAYANVGIFTAQIPSGTINCSLATSKLMGQGPEPTTWSFARWLNVLHPDDREHAKAASFKAAKDGEPYSIEHRICQPDGQQRWLCAHGLPLRDANGKVEMVYGVVADITRYKQLELELSARDLRMRDACLAAGFFLWQLDLESMEYTTDRPRIRSRTYLDEGRDVRNAHFVDRYGLGGSANAQSNDNARDTPLRNETLVTTLENSLTSRHPEDRPKTRELVRRIVAGELSTYELEARSLLPDGSFRWTRSHARAIKDETGKPRWLRGIVQDVHNRKQAETRLAEAEARLRRATHGTNDGLWEYEISTRQFWVSARFAEMLGYTQEDFLQERVSLREITDPEHYTQLELAFQKHLEGGEPVDQEIRRRTKTGVWRWMRIRGSCERGDEPQPQMISGSQQDVTELKESQRALIAATETAARADKAKGEFLANMSHEIRTPMNGVIGMTELLLDTPLSSMQRDYAQTIRQSAAALLTVINDILDFSKVEAGKLELECTEMSLHETIEDVARLLAVPAHAKGLEVVAHLDPELPQQVMGDAGRLRQILLNLTGNAVKFTQAGEILIQCRVLERAPDATLIRCEVRDTGIGIPADRLGALFQPFAQVDTTTTRRFGGTGLGLSIVKRLAELMGGEVGVQSEAGAGSTFWFTARFTVTTSATVLAPSPRPALPGQRVLLVDDNATNRNALMEQLARGSVESQCAGSADEALSLLRQATHVGRPFDAIIIDHQMPGCDGVELGALIRNDSTLRSVPMLLLTCSSQRSEGKAFAELGFAGCLVKPVKQRDLLGCMARLLGSQPDSWSLQTQRMTAKQPLDSQRVRASCRILLAEDNAVNQKVACRLLEKLGYEVDVAEDGQAAFDAWSSGRYGLILMDCQMPVLDGFETTRKIRAAETGAQHIPIVALTAHAMKGADNECTAAGMDDYLSKPIDRELLSSCLERHLSLTPPSDVDTRAWAATAD